MSNAISTPYFLVDETRLTQNLEILRQVADQAGCKILLAQKAFSVFSCYPLLRRYLAGSTASGLYEARLGREHFGGETHVFSPAYKPEEFEELRATPTILYSIRPASCKSSARWPRRRARRWACG